MTDFVIYLVITKFCDEFVTQFGVKSGDHHFGDKFGDKSSTKLGVHQIWCQSGHQN